ncbi:MAG: CAP domain-containing protein [Phyllobacterium sp.]
MNDLKPVVDRRWLLQAGGAGILLALAGCQTASRQVGTVAGASSAGTVYLSQIRTAHGLTLLKPDKTLENAARQQADYMARAGKMSHTTSWRKDFATRVRGNGIEGAAAENLAHGRMDMPKLFDMWMNSQGHRRNMLDPRFNRFGLAYASEAGGEQKYWALVLGR